MCLMWNKLKNIWPKSIETPHVPLGIDIEKALVILKSVSPKVAKEEIDGELSYRINSNYFDMAIYENNSKVSSIWYNDPSGRLTPFGKKRKIKLYLNRYGDINFWEKRMNNGWMTYYFNDADSVAMVYGNDQDVIRINEHIISETNDEDFVWRPENITVEIKSDNTYLRIGKYLEFEQNLELGEYGWTQTKLNIPNTWHISEITKDAESFYIHTKEHGKYIINSRNFGDLNSDLLSVPDDQDTSELDKIWKKYAKCE